MKRLIVSLAALVMALPMLVGNAMATDYGKQKVVYHVNYDNPKQQAGALRNIQNHINAVGAENLELKVVLHGNGLSMLVYPDSLKNTKLKHANATEQMQAKVDGLKGQGVTFNVCANTLKGKKISLDDDLYNVDESTVVPSGVAHVAYLQAQGYSYIKP
jgi:intracellular sulfur oxidation DsrE/DsrF family protein